MPFKILSKKHLLIIISVLIFGVVRLLVIIDPLSRYEYVILEAMTDEDTIISVYATTGLLKNQNFAQKPHGSAIFTTGGLRVVRLPLKNRISPTIKIRVAKETSITINSVLLASHFGKEIKIQGKDLWELIDINVENGWVKKTKRGVSVQFAKKYGEFQLRGPIRTHNVWFSYGIPIVVSFLVFLLLKSIDFTRIPIYQDMVNRSVKHHVYRKELDGLRGIAAIFVLLEHSWAPFLGLGRTGVWLFFLLSGYLLSQPFVSKPERAIDLKYLEAFMLRRIFRILPMYFFTIILLFGVSGHADKILTHILFVQADGYLWTISQEIYFYLLLPWLMAIIYFIGITHRSLGLATLIIVTALFLYKPEICPIHIFAYGRNLPLYLGWFLTGSCVAFLNPEILSNKSYLQKNNIRSILSYAGLLLFLLMILSSIAPVTNYFFETDSLFSLKYKKVFAIAGAILLMLILLTPGTKLSKTFTWAPFRAIGIVGFSFYLLHPIILDLIRNLVTFYFNRTFPSGAILFSIGFLCTWMAATVTYSLIERPFMKRL